MGLWLLKIFHSFSAGTVFIRQILTYKDGPRTERGNVLSLKTVYMRFKVNFRQNTTRILISSNNSSGDVFH